MRGIFSYVFLLLYLLIMFKPYYTIIEYYVNQDYIAQYLCVNRYEPQTHCQGKCYLRQKLQEKQAEESQEILNQFKESPVHVSAWFSWIFSFKNSLLNHQGSVYLSQYKYYFHHEIFRPPIFV